MQSSKIAIFDLFLPHTVCAGKKSELRAKLERGERGLFFEKRKIWENPLPPPPSLLLSSHKLEEFSFSFAEPPSPSFSKQVNSLPCTSTYVQRIPFCAHLLLPFAEWKGWAFKSEKGWCLPSLEQHIPSLKTTPLSLLDRCAHIPCFPKNCPNFCNSEDFSFRSTLYVLSSVAVSLR